jgi:hypothetical protein
MGAFFVFGKVKSAKLGPEKEIPWSDKPPVAFVPSVSIFHALLRSRMD